MTEPGSDPRVLVSTSSSEVEHSYSEPGKLPLPRLSDLDSNEWNELEQALIDPKTTADDLKTRWPKLMVDQGGIVFFHTTVSHRMAVMKVFNALTRARVKMECNHYTMQHHDRSKFTRGEMVGFIHRWVWGRQTDEWAAAWTNHIWSNGYHLVRWERLRKAMPNYAVHHAVISKMATGWEQEHIFEDVTLAQLVAYARKHPLSDDKTHPAQVDYDMWLDTLAKYNVPIALDADHCSCFREWSNKCPYCVDQEQE